MNRYLKHLLINRYFVPYETVLVLRDIGFDERLNFTELQGEISNLPLLDQVVDWFAARYKIYIWTSPQEVEKPLPLDGFERFYYHVQARELNITIKQNNFTDRIEALHLGIHRANELVLTRELHKLKVR